MNGILRIASNVTCTHAPFLNLDKTVESTSHRLVKLLQQPTFLTDTDAAEKQEDDDDVGEEELDSVDGHISIEENDAVIDPIHVHVNKIGKYQTYIIFKSLLRLFECKIIQTADKRNSN